MSVEFLVVAQFHDEPDQALDRYDAKRYWTQLFSLVYLCGEDSANCATTQFLDL